jgi:triphosphoribosyl-dephospho-CoA synthase
MTLADRSPPLPRPVGGAPPLSVGDCAVLACLWEATAAKPGNVYRGADFDDVGLADFLASAAAIRSAFDRARQQSVGRTILEAACATRSAVAKNTNLGIILLLAPLAAAPEPIAAGLPHVLRSLTRDDARLAYEAIRGAAPGGLGAAAQSDVRHDTDPQWTLLEAMAAARERDLVARQYADDFAEVWSAAEAIERVAAREAYLEEAIVAAYLELLARRPDTLISRKCGPAVAAEAMSRAASARAAAAVSAAAGRDAAADLDFWLRSDGHRRNPGSTADVIAAALFVLLRENRLAWPVRFCPLPSG